MIEGDNKERNQEPGLDTWKVAPSENSIINTAQASSAMATWQM